MEVRGKKNLGVLIRQSKKCPKHYRNQANSEYFFFSLLFCHIKFQDLKSPFKTMTINMNKLRVGYSTLSASQKTIFDRRGKIR